MKLLIQLVLAGCVIVYHCHGSIIAADASIYFLSASNGLCSDTSALTIPNKAECKFASTHLEAYCRSSNGCPDFIAAKYKGNEPEKKSEWPSGCYMWYEGETYWNRSPNGSPNQDARQVCKHDCMTTGVKKTVSKNGTVYVVPEQNKACVFPFTYNEKDYSKCTKDFAEDFWCGTQNNVNDDAGWGVCDQEITSCHGE